MAREQEREDRRKSEMKRAAEKAAAEAERKRLEMNSKNFPTLGAKDGWNTIESTKPKNTEAKTPVFANMARDWKTAEDTEKLMTESRRQAALRQERDTAVPVFIYRKQQNYAGNWQTEEEQPEEDYEFEQDRDWSNVTHRRPPRREITDAEIEEKYARSASEDDEDEHNADLFDGRRREVYNN
jgi:hypothetical protein